jgi:thiol-disulfide isomerase/thioredoxin
MHWRNGLLILLAAILAACLGLVASVALYGPGPLMRSELGRHLLQPWMGESAPAGLRIAEPGDRVTPIRLSDLDGRIQVLPAPGRPLLINYWAAWCAPCRGELPLLAEFARHRPAGRMQVVGIALDNAEDTRAFVAGAPIPYPTLVEAPGDRDSSVQLGNRRGVLPFSVLIGADGRLLKRQFGAFESADELAAWAAEAEVTRPAGG